jgi:hypothetical protein
MEARLARYGIGADGQELDGEGVPADPAAGAPGTG